MNRRFLHLTACATLGIWLWPSVARAGKYDLDLTSFGQRDGSGITQDDAAFRTLSSELGTMIAPQPMDPADSLGLSGFALSADFSVNTISGSERYWRDATRGESSNVAPTLQVMGRKGLYPGLEVGAGAVHVFDSRMWALAGYGKIAFHEGFHHLPIPSVAIRVTGSRLLGAKDFNMTTAAPAITVSHLFGLGKSFSLTPYLGYEALIIISRSTVLDATPSCDEFQEPVDPPSGIYNDECVDAGGAPIDQSLPSEFVFKNAGAIVRHRPHLGVRMLFSVIRLGFEAMFTPPGKSTGTISGNDVADSSGFQQQYTFSVGLDF
jgi:hypothetical protein